MTAPLVVVRKPKRYVFQVATRDKMGRVVVATDRDNPPLAEGGASVVIFKIENGILKVVTIRDTDERKGGGKNRQLPSGRAKRPEGNPELPRGTAWKEMAEEAGINADSLEILEGDLWPVCEATKQREFLRDEEDEKIMEWDHKRGDMVQKQGPVSRWLFAFYGDTKLNETTDVDAKDPRWVSLEEIINESSKKSLLVTRLRHSKGENRDTLEREIQEVEKTGNIFSLSHIVYLFIALQKIAEGWKRYLEDKDAPTHREDKAFFEKIHEANKKSRENYDLLMEMGEDMSANGIPLDPFYAVKTIVGSEAFARRFLQNFRSDYFGAKDYCRLFGDNENGE